MTSAASPALDPVPARTPVVTVVTVTYADRWRTALSATVDSVLADPRTRLIVVCNGVAEASMSPLSALAEAAASRVELLVFDANLGSAPAFAAGLAAAYRQATPVLILDDDNPLPDGAIDRLQAVSAALDDRGAAPTALSCFRAVNPVHTLLREGVSPARLFTELRPGAFLTTDVFRPRHTDADAREVLTTTLGDERIVELGNAMWGGTFLPASVAGLGILPPPELVLYGDDNAFSQRLRAAGGDIRLCLDIEISDSVDWRSSAEPARRLMRIPRVLHTAEDQLWRVRYQARNAAYLSARQAAGSVGARVRLAVNATVRLGLLLAAALVAGRVRVFGAILGASIDGLWGRLGQTYPLPGGRSR